MELDWYCKSRFESRPPSKWTSLRLYLNEWGAASLRAAADDCGQGSPKLSSRSPGSPTLRSPTLYSRSQSDRCLSPCTADEQTTPKAHHSGCFACVLHANCLSS